MTQAYKVDSVTLAKWNVRVDKGFAEDTRIDHLSFITRRGSSRRRYSSDFRLPKGYLASGEVIPKALAGEPFPSGSTSGG